MPSDTKPDHDLDRLALAFRQAAGAFAAAVGRPEVEAAWGKPSACAGYTVGTLVGHVNSAIGWLEPLLSAPEPADLTPVALADFYATAKIKSEEDHSSPLHTAVRTLSEQAGRRGWEWNAQRFGALAARVLELCEGERPDRLLDLRPIAPIAARLDDFLCTRILEIVVHTDDLSVSVSLDPPEPHPMAADVVLQTAMATARRAHGDLALVRALTRGDRITAAPFPVF